MDAVCAHITGISANIITSRNPLTFIVRLLSGRPDTLSIGVRHKPACSSSSGLGHYNSYNEPVAAMSDVVYTSNMRIKRLRDAPRVLAWRVATGYVHGAVAKHYKVDTSNFSGLQRRDYVIAVIAATAGE